MPEQSETTETTYRVLMHFGDGSFKEIDMPADDPSDAEAKAREWVSDNAWFECETADGAA